MRKALFLSGCLLLSQLLFSQTNAWTISGNNIWNALPGYVGIGTAPSYSLDVAGFIHSSYAVLVHGANSGGWHEAIIGPSGSSGNLMLQGNAGSGWNQFWLSGGNGIMKLGGSGGTEPSQGAINIDASGNVAIGTLNTTSGFKLGVNGTAVFDGVTVKSFGANNLPATPWADYVFKSDYRLRRLDSLEAYIRDNNHLPGVPTADEVEKNGIDLAATQAKLLEKIEELTLYTIELQKQVDELKKKVSKRHH
jgi:hypothetical protein